LPQRGRATDRRPRPERDRSARRAAAGLALLLLAGCGAPDVRERDLCERALAVLEPEATAVEPGEEAGPDVVTLRYAAGGRAEALSCRFARDQAGAPELAGVAGSAVGELSAVELFLLRVYGMPEAETPAPGLGPAAYLAQQLVNATGPAAIYALLALGYSLLYGLIGRINLAFGEFCAYGTLAALGGAFLLGSGSPGRDAAAAVLAVLPLGAALGRAAYGLILRPLVTRTSLAFLVATLGLSIFLSETMRLAQGSRGAWFPPGFARPLTLWSAGPAAVTVSTAQILAAALATGAVAGIAWLMRRTAFGRAWRACADDPGAAALVGVDIPRMVRRSSVLAATCATLSGAAVAVQYGVVGFDAGLLLGFKALTAAIVGGIGSPAGAVLGGVLIGLAETLWAAYLSGPWRDVVVFGILTAGLVLRPYGLLGRPFARDNPMLWRGREG
jgi:branched-chain amino acid transport system permease protein